MTAKEQRAKTIVAASIGGLLVLAVGGRLAYTEMARSAMNDYERRVTAAIADPEAKRTWDRKLEAIEAKYTKEGKQGSDCEGMSDQVPVPTTREPGEYWIPDSPVTDREVCFTREEEADAKATAEKVTAIEALGTYEAWAVMRSGVHKTHRWTKYPKDLQARIRNGERGLMLGRFWNYIL